MCHTHPSPLPPAQTPNSLYLSLCPSLPLKNPHPAQIRTHPSIITRRPLALPFAFVRIHPTSLYTRIYTHHSHSEHTHCIYIFYYITLHYRRL